MPAACFDRRNFLGCLQPLQVLLRHHEPAAYQVLNRFFNGDVQVDGLAFQDRQRIARHRHGRRRDEDAQHGIVGGGANIAQAVAGDEGDAPHAGPREFYGHDPLELNLLFAEKEIADLLDGLVNAANQGQPLDGQIEAIAQEAADAGRHELAQDVDQQDENGQETGDGVMRLQVADFDVTLIDPLGRVGNRLAVGVVLHPFIDRQGHEVAVRQFLVGNAVDDGNPLGSIGDRQAFADLAAEAPDNRLANAHIDRLQHVNPAWY